MNGFICDIDVDIAMRISTSMYNTTSILFISSLHSYFSSHTDTGISIRIDIGNSSDISIRMNPNTKVDININIGVFQQLI